jgi:hypothetical protein
MFPFLRFVDMVFDIHLQPVWEDIINKPNDDPSHGNGVHVNPTGLTDGGLSAYPAGLTASPRVGHGTPLVVIDIESPSSKSRAASERAITTVREKIVLPIIPH